MEKKMKMVMLLAAAAFIGGIAWVVFSIPKEENIKEAVDPGPRLMEYSSNTIREEKDGKVVWEIYAEQSQMNVDTQDTVFQNVKGKYYQGDKLITISAPHGVYNSKTRNVRLDGGTKAVTSDNETLDCSSLEWIADEGRLLAIGKAKLVRGDVTITADRIEAADEFNSFKAQGNAHIVKGKE